MENAIRKHLEENAELKKQVAEFVKEKTALLKQKLIADATNLNGLTLVRMKAPVPAETVKDLAFQIRNEIKEDLLFVAGTLDKGKPMLTVMLSDNLVAAGMNAGAMVREAAKLIQGGGGGQKHFATAGGKNPDGLGQAIEKVIEMAQAH